ncbi:MAG: ATP-dependent sacrificial sulfur transferase LarE [Bacteroidales bacterium]|nr:ATP-dependent sacrificial sulfur transferase LarE [Bacteroidales bacterium]
MIDHPKFIELVEYLEKLDSAVIAYSGGTDSTFLLAVAQISLKEKFLAITIDTPYIARWEIKEAIEICEDLGVRHKVIQSEIINSIKNNPKDRCYLCKKHLFTGLLEEARKENIKYVLDGTNLDDMGDYRPGRRALKELEIKSPLLETGIGKDLIRKFSKELNLKTWDKPAYACLLTRIPYDVEIKNEELERIELSEAYLMSRGFRAVRVRSHGGIARIEIPKEQLPELLLLNNTNVISNKLKSFGYQFVSIDMEGYRMGSYLVKE